ncbi:MAG: hypothetical protein HOQ11_02085 [Gemmatimonadaceae bacterium]|nr:hypothetical protein [Gemmatimonadaceae bacterium]NUQ92087.1 hypothetical protein [Gemmatimonadaceae bacterium]NUR33991.1 hypothetical protein [Gemmatimonadaceae bacterium]NUS96177.1 hypothetical protein [Gemmatimonadaceae bacterium]
MRLSTGFHARRLIGATLLAGGVVMLAGCKSEKISFQASCFMDSCLGGGGYQGPFTVTSIVGFPRARVDSTGAVNAGGLHVGRIAVGDSVVLYEVQHLSGELPCTASDTIRTVSWSAGDSTVLRPRSDPNGRGVLVGVKAGLSSVYANYFTPQVSSSIWACAGTNGIHIGQIEVR